MSERINPPACMTVPAVPRGRGKPLAAKSAGLRERAWWLIRTLCKPFTLDDLLFTLNDSGQADAVGHLGKYLRHLERCGVLTRLARRAPGRAPTSNGCVIWRLRRDLGPKAPVWRDKAQALWDPNGKTEIRPADVRLDEARPAGERTEGTEEARA